MTDTGTCISATDLLKNRRKGLTDGLEQRQFYNGCKMRKSLSRKLREDKDLHVGDSLVKHAHYFHARFVFKKYFKNLKKNLLKKEERKEKVSLVKLTLMFTYHYS